MSPAVRPCTDRAGLLAVYEQDRPVHPYGIADLLQLWDRSRWWRADEVVIGLLDLPGSPVPVVYAIAARAPEGTLEALASLVGRRALPDRFVITGPRGLTARLAGTLSPRWSEAYVKQALTTPEALPAPDPAVRVLTAADLPALGRLHASDDSAGAFFHAGLLDSGAYVGLEVDGALVASAGVHVLERTAGVAALGNVVTLPAARGRGFARRVVATLCHRLDPGITTIGLNVAEGNLAAQRLYQGLGFTPVHAYEEAELVRHGTGPLHDADDSGSLPVAPPLPEAPACSSSID
ncbi:MAG: GNAT family N-acetyltransferase [Nitriliruptoraceae bacterium]